MAYNLDYFLDLPRVSGLRLSPDGRQLVGTVSSVAPDGKKFRAAVWEFDIDQQQPARRLTRSVAGESGPAFLPDGSLLFISSRPDPDAKEDGDDRSGALWRLPRSGGEAELLLDPPGGVSGLAVAPDTGRIALAVEVADAATDLEHDAELAKARKEAGVSAQLFDRLPIRYWDRYLGPRYTRVFVTDPDPAGGYGELREVARDFNRFGGADMAISPDGETLWLSVEDDDPAALESSLVAVDVDSGKRRVIASEAGYEFESPLVSPDGTMVAAIAAELPTPQQPGDQMLVIIDAATGERRNLLDGFDRWAEELSWAHDSSRLFFVADDQGHRPVFSVMAGSGRVVRLTGEGAFHAPNPHPDGDTLFALGGGVDAPPGPVRLTAKRQEEPVAVPAPGRIDKLPGRLREVTTTAVDGTPLRAWLAQPRGATGKKPAPLVVFVHGGPLGSWNDWQWRWNPWLLVERGYAVLLPDPAISTGYGIDFIARGHRAWGDAPYTDVLALTDAAIKLAAVDGERTALMGGSFGGYMANWVASHTDRFDCIVTHASLWALDQFHGTTDAAKYWQAMWGSPYDELDIWLEHSPHRSVADISTPMLVIHGELDLRVPIGEGLRLWTDLQLHGVDSKFLYFPDENHWVLKPQNTRLWYETVFAWLDQHLLGSEWEQPELL